MRAALTDGERLADGVQLGALRLPLALKLVGANLVAVALLLGAWLVSGGTVRGIVIVTVTVILLVHPVVVLIALRPIRDLENVASRVLHGDFGARVVRSRVADREVLRVGSMFNLLLDGLVADRARLRALASEVIAVGDQERAAIARALHDSTAQHIAALQFQLSVAARDSHDASLTERLYSARDSAERILEEVRNLSYAARPALLDDLGLEAALRRLASDASAANSFEVEVAALAGENRLPASVEAVLYRVAEEGVRSAARHSDASALYIQLRRQPDRVTLEIRDDGAGQPIRDGAPPSAGHDLGSLRERLALVDGWLDIRTDAGLGTTLCATVPLAMRTSSGAAHAGTA